MHTVFVWVRKPWGLRIPSGIIVFADKSLFAQTNTSTLIYREDIYEYVCVYRYI